MRSRPEFRWFAVWLCCGAGALAAGLAFQAMLLNADEPWRATQEERRERLLKIGAAEKERLEQQTQRFESLAPAEKQKLRDIHDELSKAPDGDQLFAILQRYCEWLKTLDEVQRGELMSLTGEERVAKIRQFMKQQEERRFRQLANLPYEDTRAVLDWLDKMVEPHEEELLALLSREAREAVRNFKDRFDDPRARRKMMVWWLFKEGKRDELRNTIQPSPDDLQRLLGQLSQETQDDFKKLDAQKQQELVRNWIGWAVFRPSYRPVTDSELHEFFKGLPSEQQAKLERLPHEEMHHELRKLYYASRFPGPDWGRPGEGPGRGGFRGPYRDGGGRFDRSRSDEKPFAKPPGT
jgi:hypothetical protein